MLGLCTEVPHNGRLSYLTKLPYRSSSATPPTRPVSIIYKCIVSSYIDTDERISPSFHSSHRITYIHISMDHINIHTNICVLTMRQPEYPSSSATHHRPDPYIYCIWYRIFTYSTALYCPTRSFGYRREGISASFHPRQCL